MKLLHIETKSTHPDSSDRLRRSIITQYYCGFCKFKYLRGYSDGILQLLH